MENGTFGGTNSIGQAITQTSTQVVMGGSTMSSFTVGSNVVNVSGFGLFVLALTPNVTSAPSLVTTEGASSGKIPPLISNLISQYKTNFLQNTVAIVIIFGLIIIFFLIAIAFFSWCCHMQRKANQKGQTKDDENEDEEEKSEEKKKGKEEDIELTEVGEAGGAFYEWYDRLGREETKV